MKEFDLLFKDAAELVVIHQNASTSFIQRHFRLGYMKTGRIIAQLEDAGIIGQFQGAKPREVLIPDLFALEKHLEQFN